MHTNVDKLMYECTKDLQSNSTAESGVGFWHFPPRSKALRYQEVKLPFESLGCSAPRAEVKKDWGTWSEVEAHLPNSLLNVACRAAKSCVGVSDLTVRMRTLNFRASHSWAVTASVVVDTWELWTFYLCPHSCTGPYYINFLAKKQQLGCNSFL